MKLYLVIPCYNEEAVLPETSKRLKEKYTALMDAGKISTDSRIVFVNDGSKDRTWEMICDLHREDPVFCADGGAYDRQGRVRRRHFSGCRSPG